MPETQSPSGAVHVGLHDCNHDDCSCFWCRVSRREQFPTIIETMDVKSPENGQGDGSDD